MLHARTHILNQLAINMRNIKHSCVDNWPLLYSGSLAICCTRVLLSVLAERKDLSCLKLFLGCTCHGMGFLHVDGYNRYGPSTSWRLDIHSVQIPCRPGPRVKGGVIRLCGQDIATFFSLHKA